MANPYTDMRAITARLGQVQPRGATTSGGLNPTSPTRSDASIQLGRAANKFSVQNPQLRAELEAIAGGSRSEKPSGFLGTVLGNPIAKTALKGLEAFALPGRAVVAASRELVDAFDGNDKTKASFSDFGKNVKDSTYGFGKAFKIDTGSKWLDRAIGFTGDIALDPLTYATFGASAGFKAAEGAAKGAARVGTKTAGYANRVTLANRVLAKTGDNALAKAISIEGRSALRRVANGNEILERVGANKFGVYFFGKRVKVGANGMGWRLPLSGTIGEIGEATLSKARLAITNTKMGKYMQKMSMPKDFLNLRLAAARGALNPEDTAMALKLFDAVPKQRLARATAQQAIEQELIAILKAEEPNIEMYRKSIHKFLEDPAKLAAASEPEKRAAAVWKAHLDTQWERVSGRWKEVDEAAELGKTENYFPRVRTDEAQKFMNSEAPYASDIRAIYMEDPFALPGAFTPRSLGEGKKWFGKILKKEDLNIESLNRIAREEGKIDFDFFETDVVNAMKKYASDTADELGIIERNAALKEAGFFDKIDEMKVRELEINEDDIVRTRQVLEEQDNILVGIEQDFRQSVINLTDNVRAEAARVSQGLATGQRLTDDMSRYLYDMVGDISRKIDGVNQAKARLVGLFGPESSIPIYSLSDDFPWTMRPMLLEFDQMTKDLADYQMIISDLQAQAMKEGYTATQAEEALRQIEEAANATHARLKDAQESIKTTMELGNAIEGSWESIVNGGLGVRAEGSVAQQVIKDMRNILGSRNPAGSQAKRAQAMGITGRTKDWMRNALNPNVANDASADFFKSFWDEISGSGLAGIKPSAVTDMSEEKFFNIILNAASPDANLADLRTAAAYAVGRDIRLYQAKSLDDLPRFVRRFHEELRAVLKEAEFDEAQRIARSKAGKNLQSKIEILKTRWGASYKEAVNMKNTLDEYNAVGSFVRNDFAGQFGEGWENLEFTEALIPALEEAAGSGRLQWMYDYIDDADITLGKQSGETVTLGEVIEHVDYVAGKLRSSYFDDTIEIEDVLSANLVQNQSGRGQVLMTRQEFVGDYESKIRQARKVEQKEAYSPSSEFKMSKSAKRRMSSSTVGDEMSVKSDLSGQLVQYQAVSDAVQKFEAISSVLAPHGMVPTEDMWRGILRTVSNQYGSQYQDKVRRIIAGEEKFIEFYAGFTKKLQEMKRLPAEEQIPISSLFKQSLEDLLGGVDSDIMTEILGPAMGRLVDKTDMGLDVRSLASAVRATEKKTPERIAAKLQYDNYVERYVIPWAKGIDPTIVGKKGPAVDMLKTALNTEGNVIRTISKKTLRDLRTPLSRDASELDVYNWFNSMLKTVDPQTGETIAPGAIAQMRSSYQGSEIFFRRMKDGYLDVEDFFKTLDGSSNTPAGYATQMIELANRLDGAAPFSGYTHVETLAEIGTDYKQIYKAGDKPVVRLEKEAAKTARAAQAARQVADAFNNPNLTHEELKALGFSNQTMREAYDYVADLQRFEASADYAMAMHDQDMVNFLDAVAGVNFAQFDEGVVVGTQRVEKFADDVLPETTASAQEQINTIRTQLTDLDAAEAASKRRVLEPFTVERNGKLVFKSPDAKRYARIQQQAWQRLEQGKFRGQRQGLMDQLSQAEQRAARAADISQEAVDATRTVVGFEDVPVFAKMPDGTNIKFTQSEWDSLYIPPYNQEGLKNAGAAARTAVKRRKTVQGLLENARDAAEQRAWDPAKRRYVRQLERELAQLDQQIPVLEGVIERNMKVVRNSALEKVRILVKQMQEATPQDGGVHWMNQWSDATDQLAARTTGAAGRGNVIVDNDWIQKLPYSVMPDGAGQVKRGYANSTLSYYFDKLLKTDATISRVPAAWGTVEKGLQTRRNSLQAMWRSNPSHAVLQQREELARYAAMTGYDDFERYAKQLEKASGKARELADRARVAVDDVQTTFKKAIDEMRNAELRAAQTAGATFDTKTPFWATNKEVKYVLNGKEYSVPSVSDMLQDPTKYIKRAQKRGDLFFDMKKPGNVAMWADAGDEARASMALFGLQTVVMRDSADLIKANVVNPSWARANETYNIMLQWSKDAETLAANIKNVRDAIQLEKLNATGELRSAEGALYKTQMDVFEFAAELRGALAYYDPLVTFDKNGLMQMETLVSALQKRSQMMERVVQGMPSKADNAALASSKKPATRAKWMQVHLDWINGNRSALRALAQANLDDPGEAKVWNAFLNAFAAEGRFTAQEGRVQAARSAVDTAKAGTYIDRVLKPATEEFNKAADKLLNSQGRQVATDFNMPGYSVSSQVNELVGNLKRINDGAVLRELGDFMSSYTGFFKAYATLSPGFHVRNSISNTFQLFAAGAEVKNMRTGLKLWRSLGEHVKGGGNIDSWIASGAVPEALKTQARVGAEVSLALGGGKTDDAFAEFITVGSNILTDNAATRASRNFGRRVEGSARFMLAFDSAQKGMDFNSAFNHTGRYLIDYSNPTLLDESVRNIIPFWTWMSRNLPIQITTQWTNPKPYVVYQRFANNFMVQDDEQLPEYVMKKNPIQIGKGTFLTPDLPFMSAQETIDLAQDPRKALSMINPGLRVPMELAGGRQFFTGREFGDQPGQQSGTSYAVQNLLPMLGQLDRITKTGPTSDNLGFARYLGVPIRGQTDAGRDNEFQRRMYELSNYVDKNGGR